MPSPIGSPATLESLESHDGPGLAGHYLLGAAAPPLAGQGSSTVAPSGSGAPTGQGQPAADSTFMWVTLLFVLALVAFTMFAQRKDRKRREALLSAVKRHDRVQTTGGVIGSVVEVKGDTVVLKVDESSNTRITFARSAIQQILKEAPESGEVRQP